MGLKDRFTYSVFGRPESQRFLLLSFAAFYLLGCFAPLRLEYDSIHYFSLKECLENACPAGFHAADDPHPLGYPVLLLVLSRLGLLHSFVIAGINALFLAGSLFFVSGSFPPSLRSFLFFPLVCLHWTFIKFFAYPLSEMQYLFFSTGCLYCFQRYTREKKWLWLIAAFAGAGLAFFTRSAGCMLVPALLVGLMREHRQLLKLPIVKILLVGAGILSLTGVFLFSKALRIDMYLRSLQERGSPVPLLREHLKEWGQLIVNVPGNKVMTLLPGRGNFLLIVAGLLLALVLIYALFIRRKEVPLVISTYLIAYCLLLFNWPFFDARFWIPVVPYMVVIIVSLRNVGGVGASRWAAAPRGPVAIGALVFRVLLILYFLMGLGAAGYSIYTMSHKAVLARTQAGGIFRNEYETWFFGKPMSDTANHPVDQEVLSILKRYN
ncbi:MAG TPA: glycosyltransferase family 39 protein [Puia sp.]|jgi:hypothetical protein